MKCPHCGISIPDWRIDHWPRHRVQRLLELAPHAARIGDLAAQLGLTRNSVIGKIARLRKAGHVIDVGWKVRQPGPPQPKRKRPMPAKTKPPAPSYAVKSVGNRLVHRQDRRGPDGLRLEPVFPMRRLRLVELRADTCRWPIGHPGMNGFCFCGNDCAPERSYCTPHHEFAHQG